MCCNVAGAVVMALQARVRSMDNSTRYHRVYVRALDDQSLVKTGKWGNQV